MEGAQPHEVGAAFFQLHVLSDHLDDIDAGEQFAQKGLGNGHVSIVGSALAGDDQMTGASHQMIR